MMEFKFSDLIDPSTYETESICNNIPLRKHKESFKEHSGALRAQKDWIKLVGPLNDYKGGLGSEYSFIQVTVPECLPDRLEILAYANEFAFLYDGSNYSCGLSHLNTLMLTRSRRYGKNRSR